MITRIFASVVVMSTLGLLTPIQVSALGLGKIELSSALNEPFQAEIPVTALRGDEVGNLQVQLASDKEFDRAGLVRSQILTQLKFDVVEKAGTTTIVISSKQAVKEPFLDFLLTATAGGGRLIREYTVLLDPPKKVFSQAVTTPTKVESKPVVKQPVTTDYQYTAPSSPSYDATNYGPTGRTDTLWDVALKTRPEKSVSVHQMMLALVEENPTAFLNHNINGLKAGYTLSIPALEDINKLSKKQAVAKVVEQNTLWKNRNKIPEPEPEAEPEPEPEGVVDEQQEPTAISTDVEPVESKEVEALEEAVVTEKVSEDTTTARLQLVMPTDETSLEDSEVSPLGSDQITQLSEQLTLAQETIEGQTQENIEIKSRMAVMEEQIQTLRRLISLKDADLARLQSVLEQDQQTNPDTAIDILSEEASALLSSGEQQVRNDLDMEEQSVDAMNDTGVELKSSVEDVVTTDEETLDTGSEEVALTSIPLIDDVISYTSELAGIDEKEIQSGVDKVKNIVTENKMESMLAALVLLLALWLIIRRINRPDMTWDEAYEKLDGQAATTKVNSQAEQDEPQEEKESSPSRTVEDIINDADVYVSYGDFTKAKLALQDAYKDQPSNGNVIHKLLFVLFKQQQTDEFIDLANQYQELDKDTSQWQEVVEWGRELAPKHQLFMQPEIDNNAVEIGESLAIDISEEEPAEPTELQNISLETTSSDSDEEDDLLSFNPSSQAEESTIIEPLDLASTIESTDENSMSDAPMSLDIENDDETINIDIDDGALTLDIDGVDDEPLELNITLDSNSSLSDLDDVGLEEISETEMDEAISEIAGKIDDADNEVEFDLGDFDEVDEAETKLDLATAYIDMGDPEGAKSILEEVLIEGNDEQKHRAQSLLDDLL